MTVFDENKMKIESIKLKYKISLINAYIKLESLNLFRNKTEWEGVIETLLSAEEKKDNEELYDVNVIFQEDVSDDVKQSCYLYFLRITHNDFLQECLEFLRSKDRRKFKTFLNDFLKVCKEELDDNIKNFQNRKIDLSNIDLILNDSELLKDNMVLPSILIYVNADADGDGDNDEGDNDEGDDETYILKNDDNEYDYYPNDEEDENNENNETKFNEYKADLYDKNSYRRSKGRSKDRIDKNLQKKFLELFKYRNRKPNTTIETFNKLSKDEQTNMINDLEVINNDRDNSDMYMRVLKSKLSLSEKKDILIKLDGQSSNYSKGKFNEWFESVLSFPFGVFKTTKTDGLKTEQDITKFLDEAT